jgi:hypothetical protein
MCIDDMVYYVLNRHREEDFNKARELAASAAKSGAYLYPIKVHNTSTRRFSM